MKTKFTITYSVFAIFSYICSIFYLTYSLFTEYQNAGYISAFAFFAYGKTAFLVILAFTLITLVLIIIESQTAAPAVSEAKSEEAEPENEIELEDDYEIVEDSESEENETTTEAETSEETVEENPSRSPTEEYEPSNFETILSEGIRKSIADEREYAVIIFKIFGIPKGEEWNALTTIIGQSFDAEDMIFEYNDNCLAVLKDKTTLDENLILAENTISKIENTFRDLKPVCYAGISNRNCRIVTATRLLFESEAALEHAEASEDKVIAFRADTQAYNEFINQQNQ